MQKFFKYIDVQLDTRGLYTPSNTIRVPALYKKATVEDENTIGISTPKSVFNLGYINISDLTIEPYIDELLALGGMHGIKAITNTEAKQILIDNGYIEITPNKFEISKESDIMGEVTPAKYLIIE